MENKTYKSIKPTELYSIKEVTRLIRCSRAYLLRKITDKDDPLQYVVDERSKRMKIEGSELIRFFNLK